MPPLILIPPSQLPPRALRTLRRQSAHRTLPVTPEQWHPSATHILLPHPRPSLALACAIANPSIALLHPATLEALQPVPLPSIDVDIHYLWLGRVRSAAFAIWHSAFAPFTGLRVAVVGELRPKTSGRALPSSYIIRSIITAGGGVLADDPHFAIIAPNLTKASVEVAPLVENNVLCLGSAFVLDLVLRAEANPVHYLLFQSQRHLCGGNIDPHIINNCHPPLPVVKALVPTLVKEKEKEKVMLRLRISQTNKQKPKPALRPPVSKRRSQRLRRCTSKAQAHLPAQPIPPTPPTIPSEPKTIQTPAKSTTKESTLANTFISPTTPAQSKPNSHAKRKQAQRLRDRSSSPLPPPTASSPKRPRINNAPNVIDLTTDPPSSPQPPQKQHPPDPCTPDPVLPVSPLSKTLFPSPNAPSISNNTSHRTTRRTSTRQTRKRPRSPTNADPLIPDDLSDLSDCAPEQPVAKSQPSLSFASARQPEQPFSIQNACKFCLQCIGGEPSQADISRLVKILRDGEQALHQDDDQDDGAVALKRNNSTRRNDYWNLSPAFDDDDDDEQYPAPPDENTQWTHGGALQDTYRRDQILSQRASRQHADSATNQFGTDPFLIPLPTARIMLPDVARREFSLPERASEVLTVPGNDKDDQLCQHEMDYTYWMVGAENHLGCPSASEYHPYNQVPLTTSCSRVWYSLIESSVLNAFANVTTLNKRDCLVLSGICIRLLHSDFPLDMNAKLAEQLFQLRQAQIATGYDSLHIVLSTTARDQLHFRHKAVAAIWSALLQSAIRTFPDSRGWHFIHSALRARVDAMLSDTALVKPAQWKQLEVKLIFIVEVLLLSSFAFYLRLDFSVDMPDGIELDSGMHMQNWTIVYDCLAKLSAFLNNVSDVRKGEALLTSFLRRLAISMYARVWPASDVLLTHASRAAEALSMRSGQGCFCRKPALVVSQFEELCKGDANRQKLAEMLKNPCDSILLLGWLYVNQGQGNSMKRAMSVVRSGSVITRNAGVGNGDSSAQAVNHHIGLILTVADSIASSSKSGEEHVCRLLTSKCSHLDRIAREACTVGADQDEIWRATLEAVAYRCKALIGRGGSVEVYTSWLSDRVVEILLLLQESMKRRPTEVFDREAARVTDSVLSSLAITLLKKLGHVYERLGSARREGDWEVVLKKCIEKSVEGIYRFAKLGCDLVSQLRINGAESMGKGRHSLLHAVVSLMQVEMGVAVKVCGSGNDSVAQGVLGLARDVDVRKLVVNLLSSKQMISDNDVAHKVSLCAARIAAHVIELIGIRDEGRNEATSFLRRTMLDGHEQVTESGESWDECRVAFWHEIVMGRNGAKLVKSHAVLRLMWVKTMIASVCQLACGGLQGWEDKLLEMTNQMSRETSLRSMMPAQIETMADTDELKGVEGWARYVEQWIRVAVKQYGMQLCAFITAIQARTQSYLKRDGSRKGNNTNSALVLYSFCQAVRCQLDGFAQRYPVNALHTLQTAISVLRLARGNHGMAFQLTQQRLISGLGTCPDDMETRVLVLRILAAFGAENSICGIWMDGLVPRDAAAPEWIERVERGMGKWRRLLWETCVEDSLGRGDRVALGRLEAAIKYKEGKALAAGSVRRRLGWQVFESGGGFDQLRYSGVATALGIEL